MNILKYMAAVYKGSEGCGLSNEFFSNESKVFHELKELSILLGLTPLQVTFLSIIAEGNSFGANISDIARHLDCPSLKIMSYRIDFRFLIDSGFIRFKDSKRVIENECYIVTSGALLCWSKNILYNPGFDQDKVYENMIQSISAQFIALEKGIMDSKELELNIDYLLQIYKNTFLSEKLEYIAKGDLCMKCILMYAVTSNLKVGLSYTKICHAINLSNDSECSVKLNNALNVLLSKKLIKNFKNDIYKLTARGKKLLIPEKKPEQTALVGPVKKDATEAINTLKADGHSLITPNVITHKDLFYNSDVEERLNELSVLLGPDQFNTVVERMEKNGMRTGFNCMLYGTPGTGKTEFVYQLAKRTGRAIMKVDFSTMRNKYIGDSEKAMRKAFTDYRKLVDESDVIPILLLNECDGLLGKRIQVSEVADQVNNACQAILLEELECLRGISFSTSNVPQVMDKAFERRFLYKIDFKNPEPVTRKKIWLSFNLGLTDSQADELSGKYELSGGQIENISRKMNVISILNGGTGMDMEIIHKKCMEEVSSYTKYNGKIGFIA